MSSALRQILALARTEWRLAWRGLGLRLVLVILALPFIPYLLLAHTTPDDGGLALLTFVAPLVGLLAAFLIVPSIGREGGARIADLIWVRPLGPGAYVAGKLLAAALVLAVLLAELTALAAAGQLMAGHALGYPLLVGALLVGALLVAAPSLALVAGLYLVCGILLPRPFLSYAVALVLAVLFDIHLNGSMLMLGHPWAHGHFLRRHPRLRAGLAAAAGQPAVLRRRGGRGRPGAAALRAARGAGARGERPGLAGRGGARLRGRAGRGGPASLPGRGGAVTLSGPVAAPHSVALSLRDYRLDLRLDPAAGTARGEARLTISNTGTTPVAALPVYLNDGLRIGAATVDGRPTATTGRVLFGGVALMPVLAPGATAALRISYAGRYTLLHAEYASMHRGLQAPSHESSGRYASLFQPAIHQSLIGDDLAQLFRDGDWYPWPWTQGVVGRSPAPLGAGAGASRCYRRSLHGR